MADYIHPMVWFYYYHLPRLRVVTGEGDPERSIEKLGLARSMRGQTGRDRT